MTTRKKPTVQEVAEVVKAQPLVGVNAAAAILGTPSPNFKRYRDQLTEIPVEGSASIFVKSEVQQLAKSKAKERRDKEVARAREAAAKKRRADAAERAAAKKAAARPAAGKA